jgi:hypothetical protein
MSNQGHRIRYGTLSGIDADVGGCRLFIGGIDTREILDCSLSCQMPWQARYSEARNSYVENAEARVTSYAERCA